MPTNHTPSSSEGAVSVVFRLAEVEERIDEQRRTMGRTVLEVMDLVDLLPANSMERTVVELRHIDCKLWEQICNELHMSRSRVNDYYGAALGLITQNKRAQMLVMNQEKQGTMKVRTLSDTHVW